MIIYDLSLIPRIKGVLVCPSLGVSAVLQLGHARGDWDLVALLV